MICKISSTCFGQTFAHLQERKTEVFLQHMVYCPVVVVGRGSERGNVALRVRYEGSCLLYNLTYIDDALSNTNQTNWNICGRQSGTRFTAPHMCLRRHNMCTASRIRQLRHRYIHRVTYVSTASRMSKASHMCTLRHRNVNGVTDVSKESQICQQSHR